MPSLHWSHDRGHPQHYRSPLCSLQPSRLLLVYQHSSRPEWRRLGGEPRRLPAGIIMLAHIYNPYHTTACSQDAVRCFQPYRGMSEGWVNSLFYVRSTDILGDNLDRERLEVYKQMAWKRVGRVSRGRRVLVAIWTGLITQFSSVVFHLFDNNVILESYFEALTIPLITARWTTFEENTCNTTFILFRTNMTPKSVIANGHCHSIGSSGLHKSMV